MGLKVNLWHQGDRRLGSVAAGRGCAGRRASARGRGCAGRRAWRGQDPGGRRT